MRGNASDKHFCVYILSNQSGRVLYTGVTNDLKRRVWEHKEKTVAGFTGRYRVDRLVYYEIFDDAYSAITREKQLKGGSHADKAALVQAGNAAWADLYESL